MGYLRAAGAFPPEWQVGVVCQFSLLHAKGFSGLQPPDLTGSPLG